MLYFSNSPLININNLYLELHSVFQLADNIIYTKIYVCVCDFFYVYICIYIDNFFYYLSIYWKWTVIAIGSATDSVDLSVDIMNTPMGLTSREVQ